jgi:hypothetical protein
MKRLLNLFSERHDTCFVEIMFCFSYLKINPLATQYSSIHDSSNSPSCKCTMPLVCVCKRNLSPGVWTISSSFNLGLPPTKKAFNRSPADPCGQPKSSTRMLRALTCYLCQLKDPFCHFLQAHRHATCFSTFVFVLLIWVRLLKPQGHNKACWNTFWGLRLPDWMRS